MDAGFWAKALIASQALGFIFAMAARYLPFIKNTVAPKVGFVTILLTNVALLWQEFLKNAGLQTAMLRSAPYLTEGHMHFGETAVALAGFGAILGAVLQPFLVAAQPIVISAFQYWLNRLIHEGGVKPIVKGL